MVINVNDDAPDFETVDNTDTKVTLKTLLEKHSNGIVLFFYPKDNTPGCTVEAKGFKELHSKFLAQNVGVYGVSADTLKSHQNFCKKYDFPFSLLVDKEKTLINAYEVLADSAKTAQRITFIIGANGKVLHRLEGVKTKDIPIQCLKLVAPADIVEKAAQELAAAREAEAAADAAPKDASGEDGETPKKKRGRPRKDAAQKAASDDNNEQAKKQRKK